MKISDICPICGGEVLEKEVEKLVKGGNNAAVLKVRAGVCQKCGEHLYDYDTYQRIDSIRNQLKHDQTENLKQIGAVFEAAE